MPGMMGGIPGQIVGDLGGIAESAAKQTIKAGTDIATATIETVTSAPSAVAAQASEGKQFEKGAAGSDPQVQAKKKAGEKARFEQVKNELAQFIQRKKQLDAKIAQEKAQQAQVEEQKQAQEKQQKESFTAGLLKRVSGQSHGEVMKSKD